MRQFIKNKFPGLWKTLKKTRQAVLNLRSTERVFTEIYVANAWGDESSRSGPGSNLENTRVVRDFLPRFLHEVNANSLLDLPCGDLHWMKTIDLGDVTYIGGDIVAQIIEKNRASFRASGRQFEVIDLVKDDLPAVDVLLCRDCFIHLPSKVILASVRNIKRSSIRFLITNTYTEVTENIDIELGGFRHLNLCLPPFSFPMPSQLHREIEGTGKSLGVWNVSDLNA